MKKIDYRSLVMGMGFALGMMFLMAAGGEKVAGGDNEEGVDVGDFEQFGFGVGREGFAVVKDKDGLLYVVDSNGYTRRVVINPDKDRKMMGKDRQLRVHK